MKCHKASVKTKSFARVVRAAPSRVAFSRVASSWVAFSRISWHCMTSSRICRIDNRRMACLTLAVANHLSQKCGDCLE